MILAASFLEVAFRVVLAVVLAVVTTSVSLRLLGMRRGWTTALLAGAIGWGTAAILALSLSDWDWGADGLVLHIVAIGIPATMAVAVTLDLLARPGSLAVGERAGLVSAPRPLRAVSRRVSVIRRYKELVGLARREGFGPLIGANARAERMTDPEGVRLRRVLESAGGVYVKLGQIAATRVDLLARRGVRRARTAAEPGCPRARGSNAPRPRSRAPRRGRASLRRLRLGAARRGVDRPDLRGAASDRRGGRRQDPTARHRRRDGPRPRGLGARRRGRPAAHQRRTERSLGGDPRPVRAKPSFRARLPARGVGHGGDGGARRSGRRREGPADLPRSLHAPAPRPGAVRRHDRRRRREGRRVGRRPPTPRRAAAALDARPGAPLRLLPRRPSSRERLHPQ